MKLLLLLAVAAASLALGYLIWAPRDGDVPPYRPPDVRPAPPRDDTPPDRTGPEPGALGTEPLIAGVRREPRGARAQKDLAAFVARCAARGAAAVPELVAFLRDGDNADCGRTWNVIDGELVDYPTLRAAFVEALCRIPGPESTAALRSLLDATRSGGEAYLAALALRQRGETGWARALLGLVGAEDEDPKAGSLQGPMVEMAAAAAPDDTARAVEDRAPRGQAGRDPGALARALTYVPWEAAERTGVRLLEDPEVTAKAKKRYVDALLRRPEPDALRVVRQALERGTVPRAIHKDVVATTVDAPAFATDARRFQEARRAGDEAAAGRIRGRVEARIAEARRLLETLYDGDMESAQAKESLRRLEAQLTRFR